MGRGKRTGADIGEIVRKRFSELCGDGPEGGVLVAFSGGADSTALAASLAPLAASGRSVVLGMVDHAMRDRRELEAEKEGARKLSAILGLPLKIYELPEGRVASHARQEGSGPEAAARSLRYAALDEMRGEAGLTWIAMGHNAQDQAETRIARFFQGSGPRGLKGIPARRGRIIRPLLGLYREEIEEWLRARNLPWSEDSSNARDDYLRNAVRHRILPVLETVFPGWRRALENGGRRMELIASYMEREASALAWVEGRETLSLDEESWKHLHPALKLQLLEDAASRLLPGRRVPFRFLCAAAGQGMSGAGGRRLSSGAGLEILRGKDGCALRKRLVLPAKKGYFFRVEGALSGHFPDGKAFTLSIGRESAKGPALEAFSFPAVLRNARSGDRLDIKEGSKLLSDLYQGRSGPGLESLPVLQDARGIVCVFGRAVGRENRYAERGLKPSEGSPCLELSMEGSVSSDVQHRT